MTTPVSTALRYMAKNVILAEQNVLTPLLSPHRHPIKLLKDLMRFKAAKFNDFFLTEECNTKNAPK